MVGRFCHALYLPHNSFHSIQIFPKRFHVLYIARFLPLRFLPGFDIVLSHPGGLHSGGILGNRRVSFPLLFKGVLLPSLDGFCGYTHLLHQGKVCRDIGIRLPFFLEAFLHSGTNVSKGQTMIVNQVIPYGFIAVYITFKEGVP